MVGSDCDGTSNESQFRKIATSGRRIVSEDVVKVSVFTTDKDA